MTEPPTRLIYLFCLCPSEEVGSVPAAEAGWPVEWVAHEGLMAAIARIPPTSFDVSEQPSAQELSGLAQKALWHDQQIQQLSAQGLTVLPSRMGTLFRSEESLRQLLAGQQEAFGQVLQFLKGRLEFGCKVYMEEPLFQESLQAHPAFAPLNAEMETASPGKLYLLRKKKEQEMKRLQDQLLEQVLQEAATEIIGPAVAWKQGKLHGEQLTGNPLPMVLNLSLLVERQQQAEWQQSVEQAAERLAAQGLHLVLSGPWPPYHFTQIPEPETSTPEA